MNYIAPLSPLIPDLDLDLVFDTLSHQTKSISSPTSADGRMTGSTLSVPFPATSKTPSSPSNGSDTSLSLVSAAMATTTASQQASAPQVRVGGARPPVRPGLVYNVPPPSHMPQSSSQILNAGPSVQRMSKVYSTTAEAIANFKPTPREVISGIAPHVFDERKRRRSQRRSQGHGGPKHYWYENGQKRSSPLRGATIIAWDEHSIYLEQPDHKRATSPEKKVERELPPGSESAQVQELDVSDKTERVIINKRRVKLDKSSGWKQFRVDIHFLKSIGVKLKFGMSTPSTKS